MNGTHSHGERHRHRGIVHALRVRPSLVAGGIVLMVVAVAAWGLGMHPAPAFLLGFDAGALSFMSLQLYEFSQATPASMREKARRQGA